MTTIPLGEVLTTAFTNRDALNAASDKLNVALISVERALADLRLGVLASVELEGMPGKWLTFAKDNGVWRLTVTNRMTDVSEEFELLVSSPRSVRMEAVNALPALVLAMAEAVMKEMERVEQRTADIERLLKCLKGT